MFKKSLIAVASLLAAVGTAQACSTLVIGKAVSETGNIIVAHKAQEGRDREVRKVRGRDPAG